jgi:hypothetical protein
VPEETSEHRIERLEALVSFLARCVLCREYAKDLHRAHGDWKTILEALGNDENLADAFMTLSEPY